MQLNVKSRHHEYPIVFSQGGFASIGDVLGRYISLDSIVLGCNPTVWELYGSTIVQDLQRRGTVVHQLMIPDGEQYKNVQTYHDLLLQLDEFPIHRNTAFLALGGGVTGDIVGFLASTYLRGVPFVQIPTTLLAMVDSSVGGKVGVNSPAGKNRVGSFYPPVLVFIAIEVLRTLPQEEWLCGLGEIVKHGVLVDSDILELCNMYAHSFHSAGMADIPLEDMHKLIYQNCMAKIHIVEQDEFEHGSRAMLNLGHTVGHAIESALKHKVQHGICVAWGLITELSWSLRRGILSQAVYDRIFSLIEKLGFPKLPDNFDTKAILRFAKNDKKRDAKGSIPITMLHNIGEPELYSLPVHHLTTLFQPPQEISA